jgi:cytochrome c
VLDANGRAAFERYVRAGHGYVGVHSASDTEYGWSWYGGLVGAYFAGHPAIQPAIVRVEDSSHPSTASLPTTWSRTDEWYNFRASPRGAVQVLLTLDERSYAGGSMGADHPIAWYQAYDGGRAWYTAMGHTRESYLEPAFLAHLLGGIQYAAGLTHPISGWQVSP